ncbi:MAG: DUF1850 domain-containing protein [Selenomonadaceae bacterium]|nr:DUF1850 domain-containing protein [Selenomonadaceae bacterium]
MKNYLAAAIILAFFFVIGSEKIFVTAEVNGEEQIIKTLEERRGLQLEINFIHSVQKTQVIEELEFDGDDFVLRRTKYKSQGVGLPFLESDGTFREEDGYFVMDDMNRPVKNLALRTGVGTNMTIKIDGEEIKLYEIFPVGTKIEIRPMSPFKNFLSSVFGRNF